MVILRQPLYPVATGGIQLAALLQPAHIQHPFRDAGKPWCLECFTPFAPLPQSVCYQCYEFKHLFVCFHIQCIKMVCCRPHVVGMLPSFYLLGFGIVCHSCNYLVTHIDMFLVHYRIVSFPVTACQHPEELVRSSYEHELRGQPWKAYCAICKKYEELAQSKCNEIVARFRQLTGIV